MHAASLTNTLPLPSCITVDFDSGSVSVNPTMCLGTIPITYNVRLEAWILDGGRGIKILQAYSEFSVGIGASTTNCLGSVILKLNTLPYLSTAKYSNVDSPKML